MKHILFAVMLAAVSPDLTSIPPDTELYDSFGQRWTIGDPTGFCVGENDKLPLCLPTDRLIACKGQIYGLHRVTNIWYLGKTADKWYEIGPKHPCEAP